MNKEDALELLDDKRLEIQTVEQIYNSFQDDEVIAMVAMNLSRRTSVDSPGESYSQTMVELLTKLSTHHDMGVRWAVAKSPHTTAEVLEVLSGDSVNLVRALVATNKNTPIECLPKLFEDEKIVKDGLTGNPNTPIEFLEVMAKDSDKMIRMRVASNPSTPKEVLESLQKDSEKDVAIVAQKALDGEL